MDGREYLTVTSVKPTICWMVDVGLGAGVSIWASPRKPVKTDRNNKVIFFMAHGILAFSQSY